MSPLERRRRQAILGDLDVAQLKGLEIGPLHNPLVRKSDGFVLYVDRSDTECLKKAHHDTHFSSDEIVAIDVVWRGRPLKDLVPQPIDYVVASHVLEHVPDLLGALDDLQAALADNGVICLALPDRRFTFDLRRPESTAGELVEAFLTRASRPPARHLFDQIALRAPLTKGEAWEDDLRSKLPTEAKHLAEARCVAERVASTGDYVDAHCWVFTPASFLDVAERLSGAGLFPFAIDSFHPTEYGDDEFYLRLRKSDDAACVAASIRAARRVLGDWPAERAYREMQVARVFGQPLPEESYWKVVRESAAARQRFEDETHHLEVLARYMQELNAEYRRTWSFWITRPFRWLGRRFRGR